MKLTLVKRSAWLVPLCAAMLAVLGFAALALFAFADREPSLAPRADEDIADPTSTPAASATAPRLQPSQSVCQGILNVPANGQPRVFAAAYTQRVEHNGFAIVATGGVSDRAFEAAKATLDEVFDDPELGAPLIEKQAYVIIAETGQGLLDLPEFQCLSSGAGSGRIASACGIQDRADYPVVAVSQLDLIGDGRGPCGGLNILFHELGHLVQGWSISPNDYYDVRSYYADALATGKYRNQYASTNFQEYFAEGTQAYFLHVDNRGEQDRAWLKRYDPSLYALLERVYGD